MPQQTMIDRNVGKRLSTLCLVGLCISAVSGYSESVQAYPDREITVVVQSSAGGGSDIFARNLARTLNELDLIPEGMVIENRSGGSGAVGYNYVASQRGNPHYIGTIASSFFSFPLLGQSPVGPDDFTPVASIGADPYILVVNAESDIESLEDIQQRGSPTVGSTGAVTDPRLLAAMLDRELDINARVIPFEGGGEVLGALLGGHIDLMFANPAEVLSQIRADRIRPLAVTSADRLRALPDTPTFVESGYDIEFVQPRALVMPQDIPEEALEYWQDTLETLAQSDEWVNGYIEAYNLEPMFLTGSDLDAMFDEYTERFREVMIDLGLIEE